jgi:hypothetical protein
MARGTSEQEFQQENMKEMKDMMEGEGGMTKFPNLSKLLNSEGRTERNFGWD